MHQATCSTLRDLQELRARGLQSKPRQSSMIWLSQPLKGVMQQHAGLSDIDCTWCAAGQTPPLACTKHLGSSGLPMWAACRPAVCLGGQYIYTMFYKCLAGCLVLLVVPLYSQSTGCRPWAPCSICELSPSGQLQPLMQPDQPMMAAPWQSPPTQPQATTPTPYTQTMQAGAWPACSRTAESTQQQ